MHFQETLEEIYHNRYSSSSPYKGNKKFKKLPKKCAKCGATKNLDIHHPSGNRKDLKSKSGLKVWCRSCHRAFHAAKNGGKGEFIISTAARIIEDPKTPQTEAIAGSHKNSDIMHVEFILCHEGGNKNKDRFTSDDLKDSAATAINKPVNWEHKNINIGTMYSSEFVSVKDLDEDNKAYFKKIDPLEKDFITVKAAIWEYKHPEEARVMRDRAENNELFFSMENKFGKAQCSECDEVFGSVYDYCDHLLGRRRGDSSVDRVFQDSNFVGSAVTGNPADEGAGTLALASIEDRFLEFSSLIKSNLLKDIDIEKEIIPFIAKAEVNMKIRELELPSELKNDLVDLPDEAFADTTNRIFPLHNSEGVEDSAKFILNGDLPYYNTNEKLILVENLSKAAKEYDINISEFIKEPEGGNEVPIDKNTQEFKEAVSNAVNEKLSEIESGTETKELKEQVSNADKATEAIKAEKEALAAEKVKAEKELSDYKEGIEKEKLAEARMDTLIEKGFKFEKNSDFVKASISHMKEESFDSFVSVLEEVSLITKKEEKANANADDDPVKDSQKVAIANKVDGGKSKEKFTVIDEILKEALNI